MTIIEDRLAQLDQLHLGEGSHEEGAGYCVMEAVAYITGERWSDHPQCVSPVIGAFMRSWNDSLRSDEERDRLLKPLIPVVVGTNTGDADDETRAWMATDWLVREQTPAWLRLAGLDEHADALGNLAALTGRERAVVAQPTIEAAARAGDAAGAAAWDAARAAAGDAAGDAAGAAAWDAAGDAAGDALEPTVTLLQPSAALLVRRMAQVGR